MKSKKTLTKFLFQGSHPKLVGLSLLEVFIALTIGLLLLAGVLQIFLNTRSNYYLENGFTGLQENNRFIDEYVVRTIRLAGYRSAQLPNQSVVVTPMTQVFTTALPYVTATQNTGFNGSDTLTIRYQGSGNGTGTPDGTIRDCLNNPADNNTLVTNVFSLSTNYELQCQATNANSAASGTTQVLVSGVENFQVLMGEDVNGDNSVDRYVPITYPYLGLNNIVSVRISMVLRSDQQVRPFSSSTTYNLIGTSYTSPVDKYLRTQLNETIVLRNLITTPF